MYMASAADSAQKTSWPEAERWSWRIAREIGSSSTTRMRRGGVEYVHERFRA
jgi:hypothetical protein